MPENIEIKSENKSQESSCTNSVTIQGMDDTAALVFLDKPFTESLIQTGRQGATSSKKSFEHYEVLDRTESGEATADDSEDDANGMGLDLEDFDIRNPGDLVDLLREALSELQVQVKTGPGDGGRRKLFVRLEVAGRTFEFDSEDLESLDLSANATALEDQAYEDPAMDAGGEVIESNMSDRPSRRLLWRVRATNDGENDTITNENVQNLVPTNAGIIVSNLAEINLNFGVNATLAIFVA